MALNLSCQMYSNRFLVDGSPDRVGDVCAKPWQCIRGVEDRYDYHEDRGGSNDSVNDILDVLPTDPFGMDISTAITGWLEDFDYSGYGSYEGGSSKVEYPFELYAGFNFMWNGALRFHSLPVNFGIDNDDASFTSNRYGGRNCGDAVAHRSSSSSCCTIAADCSVDDIIRILPTDSIFHEAQDDRSISGTCFDEDCNSPHQALFFALGYLGVLDLLATEGVCRSLRSTIKTDPLLWRNIHIDKPLHEKLTDDILVQLTNRAQGNLQLLSLVECSRITDNGLKHVLQSNPRITKLNIPGCTRLSIDGIVNNLKEFFSSGTNGIKYLRIGGVYGVTQAHLDDLKLLTASGKSTQNSRKPHFYKRDFYYLSIDNECSIDIEPCPICQNIRLIYDCPIKGCRGSQTFQTCRGCTFCIQRCIQCGQCINDTVFIENFCLEYLCADCTNELPNSVVNNNGHDETSSFLSAES